MNKEKIYFPNLNGLRFIAAMMVLFPHIEQYKRIKNFDNILDIYPNETGKLGVTLFFVLSGFLITYLLLAEERSFHAISIRKFYFRRVLRIWPLYFLIVILAFFLLPNIDLFTLPNYGKDVIYSNLLVKLILFGTFFSNLAIALGIIPYASHTWSIGTEEQFYVVWPVILRYCKKHRILLMLFIIASYFLFGLLLKFDYLNFLPYKEAIEVYWLVFNIDRMAIGGILAILLFRKSKYLKLIKNNIAFYSAILLVLLLMSGDIVIPYLHFQLFSVLFGIIILNFATNDKIHINLENKIFNYLGNISYGLYMFHPIAIVLALVLSVSIDFSQNWFIYLLSTTLTIFFAGLSYKYLETYFLKFKNKYSKIISGKEVKESLLSDKNNRQ